MSRGRRRGLGLIVLAVMSACGSDTSDSPGAVSAPSSSDLGAPTTLNQPPSSLSAVSSTTAAPTTTPPPTSTTTTTIPEPESIIVGMSRLGRPIEAVAIGDPGEVTVLVVGVIHGNENAGLDIVDELRELEPPDGVQLWLLPTINPDGLAADERGNAAGVDLNRNFPHNWGPIAEPGNWQYAGEGPASEPETEAFVEFARNLRPDLTLWYHQDLYRISPASGLEGEIREAYATMTGLPIVSITGGTYTGVAATWQRRTVGGIAFVVELGPELAPGEARRHADAVLAVSQLLR